MASTCGTRLGRWLSARRMGPMRMPVVIRRHRRRRDLFATLGRERRQAGGLGCPLALGAAVRPFRREQRMVVDFRQARRSRAHLSQPASVVEILRRASALPPHQLRRLVRIRCFRKNRRRKLGLLRALAGAFARRAQGSRASSIADRAAASGSCALLDVAMTASRSWASTLSGPDLHLRGPRRADG